MTDLSHAHSIIAHRTHLAFCRDETGAVIHLTDCPRFDDHFRVAGEIIEAIEAQEPVTA